MVTGQEIVRVIDQALAIDLPKCPPMENGDTIHRIAATLRTAIEGRATDLGKATVVKAIDRALVPVIDHRLCHRVAIVPVVAQARAIVHLVEIVQAAAVLLERVRPHDHRAVVAEIELVITVPREGVTEIAAVDTAAAAVETTRAQAVREADAAWAVVDLVAAAVEVAAGGEVAAVAAVEAEDVGAKSFDEEKTNENKTRYHNFVETLRDHPGDS